MFLFRRAGWIGLLLLAGVCATAWWWTEKAVSTAGFPATAQTHSSVPAVQRPLAIAIAISGLADTPEELQLADQARSGAQQLLDDAVRQQMADAAGSPEHHSGALWTRLQTTRAVVQQEKAALQALQAQAIHASTAGKPAIEAQIQLTEAQLELDQARLADAQEDLSRAGAEAASPLDVASQQKADQAAAAAAAHKWQAQWQQQSPERNPVNAHGLAALVRSWRSLAAKHAALTWSSSQAAQTAMQAEQAHQKLHAELQTAETQNNSRFSGALGALQQLRPGAASAAADAEAQGVVKSAEALAEGQRRLIGLDHTAQLEAGLAQTYQRWAAIGAAQEELALHDAAGLLLAILLGILVLLVLDRLVARALARTRSRHRRLHSMRHVVRFALEVTGVVWVLLAVLGSPAQWLTFLGLAGAGLTVALQDTILSFCGWFVLIGRHGLAPGDWVEINGISGEVIEISLLQTTLQETGNWTEPGHPTGRRVLFPNRFVFTGPYLKFTTQGQWLWDEIRVPLDNHAALPDLAALARLVEEETRGDAEAAGHEWERRTPPLHVRAAGESEPEPDSFTPVVLIKPGQDEVMDLCLRYITTAAGRAARRERLYRTIYEAPIRLHALETADRHGR